MWREFVSEKVASAKFAPPASADRRAELEEKLCVEFPDDLRSLLRETNGVKGDYDLNLVWDVDQIESDNLHFRSEVSFRDLYMPFDNLLFFGDAGNGDQFAYRILNRVVRYPDIYVWNHENDSRSWVASSLKTYFEWGESGKLTW